MRISCGICGGDNVRKLFDIGHQPPFQVYNCPDCDIAFTIPALPETGISRYYPPAYYGREGRKFNKLIEFLVYLSRLRRVQRILRYVRRGRILDVGCGGRPHFLSRMNSIGWEAHGNDIVESPRLKQLEAEGIRFQVRGFLESGYPDEYFDVVVFWHVLEHLPKPVEALRKARSLLKPGGLLVLAVPNRESLQAGWAGPHWFHLDIPRHYFHFTLGGMKKILGDGGFTPLYTSHFSFEQDIFSCIQTLYNRAGFRHDLLYDMLRTRDAKIGGRGKGELAQTLVVLVLLPFAAAAALLLFFLEVALRRGGTVEIYARKE